jgi:subtilisin family serine protease
MKAKRLGLAVAAVVIAAQCAPDAGPVASGKVGSDVYGSLAASGHARVIVVLREPEGTATSQSERGAQIAAVEKGVLSVLGKGDLTDLRQWQHISGFAGEVSAAGLRALEGHADVLRVDIDRPVHAFTAESVPLIHANEAHGLGFTGRGVTVAVLDTGVDSHHPDLADHIVDQQCFCGGCCPNGSGRQSGPGSAEDDQGHGTNVTGIIASAGRVAPVGVAPDAAIVAIKVLSRNSGGSSSDVVSALDYVGGKPDVKVVNLSLGAGHFTSNCDSTDAANMALARSVSSLRSKGVVTFVAAGNENFRDGVASPGCLSGVVTVGATYDDNVGGISAGICSDPTTDADVVTCFSNSSSLVEVLAPGALITSCGVGGGTSTDAGTSQATPHAAGAAAILLQAHPGLSPDAVAAALRETGVPVTDPKNGVTVPRIDVKAALDRVR